MIEYILASIVGIVLGVIAGLIPGVHPNLVATLMLSLSIIFLNYTSPLTLAIVIVSMSIVNTFLNALPSIFLGAPDDTTILSVLPGHRMLLKGQGYAAVSLTVIGSLLSLIIVISFTPLLILSIGYIYPLIEKYIGYILILSCIFLILRETRSKFWAFTTFALSGILGLGVLTLPNLREPLFPMLSGLFGTSVLITSIYTKVIIPKQKIEFPKIEIKETSKSLFSTILVGTIASFLPGLGPAQAAIIGSQITKLTDKGFLMLVGGLNTVNMAVSFMTLYIIDKARNGSVVIISKLLNSFSLEYLVLFLGCSLFVAGISTILTQSLAKSFSRIITKINYKILCISIIVLITFMSIYLSGTAGLFILIVSTFLGMVPSFKGVGKNHLMGCLLLPVILYFLL